MSYLPTFKDFSSGFGLNQDSSVAEIDIAWQKYSEYCSDRVERIRNDPDLPCSASQLNQLLAESVIEDHLGDQWLLENIITPRTRQAAGFLALDVTRERRLLSLYRVQELARRLHQLQSFDWFGHILKKLRTGDLSGTSFELDVLWVLHTASVNVESTVEKGRKGSDYDFSAVVVGGRIPMEAKAKDDDTPFAAKTVIGTLKGAARQLPKGDQGAVFLRIPYSWMGHDLEEEYNAAVGEGVRQTSRVGAVITAIDKPRFTDERHGNVSRHFDYYRHPDCAAHIWDFVMMFKLAWDQGWTFMAPPAPF